MILRSFQKRGYLATLYGVETKRLNEQVKRNIKRFPEDFMFQLTKDECLRSQIATLNEGRGQHLKYMPYVFTENGVAMLSSVLRSDTAIEVNIRIMRAFTSMRHFLQNNAEVFQRLSTMEYHQLEMQQHQQETDKRIEEVFRRLDEGNAKPKQGVLSPTLTARWYSISEYVPFGEVFVEERNNIWNTPYLFNAKEFDEETGLYYYGARYYDPRLSLWTSVDPLSGIAPNYSGYRYCFDNPTKFVDLLGLFETRSQAKEYRAMNGIKGRIQKNEDGTYSINPIHSARFKKK